MDKILLISEFQLEQLTTLGISEESIVYVLSLICYIFPLLAHLDSAADCLQTPIQQTSVELPYFLQKVPLDSLWDTVFLKEDASKWIHNIWNKSSMAASAFNQSPITVLPLRVIWDTSFMSDYTIWARAAVGALMGPETIPQAVNAYFQFIANLQTVYYPALRRIITQVARLDHIRSSCNLAARGMLLGPEINRTADEYINLRLQQLRERADFLAEMLNEAQDMLVELDNLIHPVLGPGHVMEIPRFSVIGNEVILFSDSPVFENLRNLHPESFIIRLSDENVLGVFNVERYEESSSFPTEHIFDGTVLQQSTRNFVDTEWDPVSLRRALGLRPGQTLENVTGHNFDQWMVIINRVRNS